MCNTKHFLFFIFLLFHFHSLAQDFGKIPFQNFSPKTYHSGNQNNGFAQNENTRLFVANNLGVLTYNGNSWESFPITAGSKIRSLAFDNISQRLYVGAQGDIGFFEKNWNYTSLKSKLPKQTNFDEVWNVYVTNDQVYFCTFQGVFIYDNNDFSMVSLPEGLLHSFLVNNKLYIQSEQGLVYELTKENQLKQSFSTNNKKISSILPYNQGLLVIYNSGAIEWVKNQTKTPFLQHLSDQIEHKYVNHALLLTSNRMAVATQLDGIFIYDFTTKSIEQITKNDGLLSNACLQLFEDYQGNLWAGLQNGLALINISSPIRTIGDEIGIEGSGYQSFETENEIYLSTSNGIYRYDKETKSTQLLSGTEGPSYAFTELYGKLYACHHEGLFLIEDKTVTQLFETTGIWNIQLDNNGEKAIAGSYNGLYEFSLTNNDVFGTAKKLNGFDESSRFVEQDLENNWWVSQYYKGIYKLKLNQNSTVSVEQITSSSGLPTNTSISITKINEKLHFATPQGIYVYDERDQSISSSPLFYKSLGNQQIDLLKEDTNGNVFVIAEQGIGVFHKNGPENYNYQPSSLYDLQYSINNDLLEASNGLSSGLLLSANEGFIHYQPQLDQVSSNHPPLVVKQIRNIRQDSLVYAFEPFSTNELNELDYQLPYSFNSLQFQFESFDYYSENRFRYKLTGLEEEFTPWTTSAFKEYSNIPPGNYELIAETQNSFGEIYASKPIQLKVKPPWYKSTLARCFYFLLSCGAIYLIYFLQRSRFVKKAKEIEVNKQLQIEEEQEKLKKVEQQSAIEIGQLKEEKMESELRHLNNLLAASTMNLVVKNEFIETIQEELKSIKKKNNNTDTQQSIHRIVKEIDTNLRLQEDWERFEHHFDQVHGDFLDRIRDEFSDLTPQDQKLCAYLRLNLNTKEIAQLMSISVRGVEMARYRLRKRLGMDTEQNLSKFILEY